MVKDNVVPFKPKLTQERALTLIREAVAKSKVLWTTHVWEQMLRRHIVDTQILAVMGEAEIDSGPRWDETYEDWVFTMCKLVSGRIVTVVIAIDEYEEVSVVTTY